MGLRDRWREGRPEFVVLVGGVIGLGGNLAWLAWIFTYEPDARIAVGLAMTMGGALSSVLAPLALQGGRTRRGVRFGLAGLAASVVVLLTPPGLIGGGIALAGSVWGLTTAADKPVS